VSHRASRGADPELTAEGNHLGYGQAKGTRATAQEITDLYTGLQDSGLSSFQMMLSGYLPGAASVEAVGALARDLKYKAIMDPGSFFWVLDPVMGDNGKLYVAEDVPPAYKTLIRDADLILPNQFEAEYISLFGIRKGTELILTKDIIRSQNC
jgi:pyridoxine kinase